MKRRGWAKASGLTALVLISLFLLVLAPLPTASAGTNQWTTNGPYGGDVYSLALSPTYSTDHTLFAGTYYGVFKSTDAGGNWSAVNTGLTSTYFQSLVLSPTYSTDHTLFAGTSGGVFKSTDAGGSWGAANAGLANTFVDSLALSPNYPTDHTLFAGTDGGVFKSTDAGGSWGAANAGLANTFVYSLAFSPNYSTDHTLFAGTYDGVFKSTDAGGNWIAVNAGLTNHHLTSLVLSPDYSTDHTLFAGTDGGVFVSTDAGSSWSATNTGLTSTQVYSLSLSPNYVTDHTLFAGTDGGVFVSTDSGGNWSAVNTGLTSTNVRSLALSPNYVTDHTLFAGTGSGGGVFVSTDAGSSWSAVNTGITNTSVYSLALSPNYVTDHTLFAGSENGGVFVSTDSGGNWSAVNTGLTSTNVRSLALSPNYVTDHTLFAGADYGGVFVSTDSGGNWSAVNTGLTNTRVWSLALSPNYVTDHTLFAGTDGGGVFKSTDAGGNWSATNAGLANTIIQSLALSPNYATDHTLFAGTGDGGVFKSTDAGGSWSALNTGLTRTRVYSLALSPNYSTDHALFAGTDGGVFKSTDAGSSWSAVSTGLTSTQVYSLALSPNYSNDHTLFAGTSGGVFVSTDAGGNWSAVNTGLTSTYVDSLAISPNFASDQTIYAGTNGGGVFSYTFGPVVTNVKPSGPISTTATTISADYSAASGINSASVAVYLDGVQLTSCTATATNVSCPVSGLGQGTHNITGSVSDNAGNASSITGSFSVAAHLSYWNWYDDAGGDNWVMLANPATASSNLTYALFVDGASQDLSGANNGVAAPGQTLMPAYPGLAGGPVAAGLVDGTNSLISQRTLWPKGGSSLEEIPGTKGSDLSSGYWWTWYDQTMGRQDWVMMANPSATADVYYQVDIARGCEAQPQDSSRCSSGKLAALGDSLGGDKAQKQFDGLIAGPVEVKGCDQAFAADGSCPGTPQNLIASQRVLTDGNAFNELPGTPASKLSDDYLWTWYDSDTGYVVNGSIAGGYDWVMIANPDASQDVYYQVSIAGGCALSDAARCQSGKVAAGGSAPQFANIIGGPVELKGCSQPLAGDGTCPGTPKNLIASQRSLIGPSFEEVPGYPRSNLASSYDWTWYDEADTKVSLNWVMISNPGAAPVSATVSFKDQTGTPVTATQTIAPGANWNPAFPGKIGGPVNVTSTGGPVLASQRVLWKGYFNEVLGTVLN